MLSAEQIASLTRIWEKNSRPLTADSAGWEVDQRRVFELGIGMQELLQHIYYNREMPVISLSGTRLCHIVLRRTEGKSHVLYNTSPTCQLNLKTNGPGSDLHLQNK